MLKLIDKHDINFYEITSMAYLDLFAQQSINCFPINPNMYKHKNIKVLSFQRYCKLANISLCELTADKTFEDGFSIQELRPGLKLLLYNEDVCSPRQNFTFIHEIAHLVLNHKIQGGKEETEANFFASQFLAPNCIIRELKNRSQTINQKLFTDFFGLSNIASEKKMDYLLRFPDIHKNEYDDIIIKKFYPALNELFPINNKYYFFDDLEKKQAERDSWII